MTYRGRIETGGFLVFLTIITIAFGAVVSSCAAALLWSALAAILFQPLYQRLLARHPGKRNLAASLVFAPLVPAGVWLGVWLLARISERAFYRVSYTLLFLTGAKLIWDALAH